MDLKGLFRSFIPFKRAKPKTKLGRIFRFLKWTLTALALLWFALVTNPQVLFPHSYSADGITLYARSPLPPEASGLVLEIRRLVQRSEFVNGG